MCCPTGRQSADVSAVSSKYVVQVIFFHRPLTRRRYRSTWCRQHSACTVDLHVVGAITASASISKWRKCCACSCRRDRIYVCYVLEYPLLCGDLLQYCRLTHVFIPTCAYVMTLPRPDDQPVHFRTCLAQCRADLENPRINIPRGYIMEQTLNKRTSTTYYYSSCNL